MRYQVTGNEYLSLPTIRESDGAIEGITFLYMAVKGLVELRGGHDGLIHPYIEIDGERQNGSLQWEREHYWIPSFTMKTENTRYECIYLTPVGERAFALRLKVTNDGSRPCSIRFGVEGEWNATFHEVNETVEIVNGREVIHSEWNHMFIWTQNPGLPFFAFAPCISDCQPFSEIDQGAEWTQDEFRYDIYKNQKLASGQGCQLDVFFGVGYESVAAATSAKELLRRGFDELHQHSAKWLNYREKQLPDSRFQELLNTNLFFTLFYASGRCIDNEELCLVTSRSPRYYVSAAYWDRDSLLWAFPAILMADVIYAKEVLEYVYKKQARNFGIHSRYIDGTVLEPGFELDELCAPVIALARYIEVTEDMPFALQSDVQYRLEKILRLLKQKKHAHLGLYETFLQPTDDMHNYPYLTYDNVLVCYTLQALSKMMNRAELMEDAISLRAAIQTHCIREQDGKRFYVWSVDENGQYDVYDEPPGSLQLLPFFHFCSQNDAIWQNTISMIRDKSYPLSFSGKPIAEIGCKHAPHPWVLSICNSLLSGNSSSALEHLTRTHMDNGIACESINEVTGECETGEAFATCAGFLSYALYHAFEKRGIF